MGHAIRAASLVALIGLTVGCAVETRPSPTMASSAPGAKPTPSGAVARTPRTFFSPMPEVAMTACPGVAWPPDGTDARDVLTAVSIDSTRVMITNRSPRTYYVAIAAGAPGDAAACEARSNGCSSGPVDAGSTLELSCHLPSRFIGVAVFGEPCGEGCRQVPIGWMVLPRSPVAPMATD